MNHPCSFGCKKRVNWRSFKVLRWRGFHKGNRNLRFLFLFFIFYFFIHIILFFCYENILYQFSMGLYKAIICGNNVYLGINFPGSNFINFIPSMGITYSPLYISGNFRLILVLNKPLKRHSLNYFQMNSCNKIFPK